MMPYNTTFRRLLLRRTRLSPEKLNDLEDLTAKTYQLLEEIRIFGSKMDSAKLAEYKQMIASNIAEIDKLIKNYHKSFEDINKTYMKKRHLYLKTGYLLPRFNLEKFKIRPLLELLLNKVTIPVMQKFSPADRKHKFIVKLN